MSKQDLKEVMLKEGFIKKHNTYFRIFGDGVFQIVKWDKVARGEPLELRIGLQSLYSELRQEWFDPIHCITRYSIALFAGMKDTVKIIKSDNNILTLQKMSEYEQIDLVQTSVLTRLNKVVTQAELVNIMCELDTIDRGSVNWLDMDKYAAFLCIHDYQSAVKVVQTIIDQHTEARAINQEYWKKIGETYVISDYDIKEMERLEKLKNVALSCNEDEITLFIDSNYRKNMDYALRYRIPLLP